MKLKETMIAWHPPYLEPLRPGAGMVKVGPHPDASGWTDAYQCSDGACWCDWRDITAEARLLRLFVMFAIMTSGDGIPAADVHNAFLEIDEYVEAMPADRRARKRAA